MKFKLCYEHYKEYNSFTINAIVIFFIFVIIILHKNHLSLFSTAGQRGNIC